MIARLPDRRIFTDTSAYYAAISRRDSRHDAVSVAIQGLVLDGQRFVTTNFILAEFHALTLSRSNPGFALETLQRVRQSRSTTIVRVRSRDEERAYDILAQYADKDFSLTDATSFAVMERLGITRTLTLDHHFAQYGWQVVPIESAS